MHCYENYVDGICNFILCTLTVHLTTSLNSKGHNIIYLAVREQIKQSQHHYKSYSIILYDFSLEMVHSMSKYIKHQWKTGDPLTSTVMFILL